jgi:hypothetical protein
VLIACVPSCPWQHARWLRAQDMRQGNSTTILSINAHLRGVQGVVLDPWNPEVVATFSEGNTELVKIWDMRKVSHCSPKGAGVSRFVTAG